MGKVGKDFVSGLISSVSGGIGSLITGGLGSAFGSLFGSDEDPAEKQFERQKELQSLQAAYNARSQAEGYRLAQANWEKQFGAQNTYNLPYNQLKRMIQAGINPYVSDSNNTGQSSLGPGTGAAAPSVGLPSPGLYDPSQSYSNFMDGISKLATASGQTIQNTSLNRKINAEIESMISDKQLKDAQAAIQSIERDYLPKIKDAHLKNMAEDTLLKVAQAMASRSESALKDALYDTEKQIQSMNTVKREQLGFDLASAIVQYNYLVDFLQARLDNLQADTEAKRAGATESRSVAKELESRIPVNEASAEELNTRADVNRQSRREISARADWQEFENSVRNTYKPEYFDAYVEKLRKEKAISEKDYLEAKSMIKSLKALEKSGMQDATPFHQSFDAMLTYFGNRLNIGAVANLPLR